MYIDIKDLNEWVIVVHRLSKISPQIKIVENNIATKKLLKGCYSK